MANSAAGVNLIQSSSKGHGDFQSLFAGICNFLEILLVKEEKNVGLILLLAKVDTDQSNLQGPLSSQVRI